MKKLMIAAAIVCAAAVSQAASFNWQTSAAAYGVDPTAVTDNGSYGASSQKNDRFDKIGSVTYTLALYDVTSGDLVGSAVSGTLTLGTLGKIGTSGIDYAGAADATAYNYVFTLTAPQSTLRAKTSDEFDYSQAMIATEYSGQITTAAGGATDLGLAVPSNWTVSGITAAPGPVPPPVPEPTSGLLLLLGVAGLALRRRRA